MRALPLILLWLAAAALADEADVVRRTCEGALEFRLRDDTLIAHYGLPIDLEIVAP